VASGVTLSACGGGGSGDPVADRFMADPQALRPELLGLQTPGTASGRETARAWRWPTHDELMDWAERTFPDAFPGHPPTVVMGDLSYRAYANGNHVGVLQFQVLLLGPITSNQLVSVGVLADYATLVLGDSQPVGASEAARFLGQAAFGGTAADIAAVQAQGMSAWLTAQMALPRTLSHWDWMLANGYAVTANVNNFQGVDNTLWRKLMSSSDVLRQRVTLALSEIFVISMDGLPVQWRGMVAAHYMDTLETHALGNYRQLLEAVTLSAGMGVYLNMRGNQKADGKGREPDENYAREVMQLFTIGLLQLNPDGTPRTANGAALETYTPDDIRGLARVFTGWDFDRFSAAVPDHAARPMVFTASRHSPEEKKFLGVTLPPGTDGVGELRVALDTLFNHPNTGPFIGRQLIQRLVTSNPSAGYVSRVAAAFANNGQGVRGDLQAVVRAVLLDGEARTPGIGPSSGKLREPMVRLVQWARTFGATSPNGLWNVGNQSSASTRLGQSPLRSPSVFNFFRPGYVPPGTSMGAAGLTAPEFQITNESTVVGYANWMQTVVSSGAGDVKADYTPWMTLASDAGALFDQFNLLLAAGQLGASSRATIVNAVGSMASSTDTNRLNRIYATVWLILCAPEYLVQK
jgi:uncharacterized protein (DUF1800 family)